MGSSNREKTPAPGVSEPALDHIFQKNSLTCLEIPNIDFGKNVLALLPPPGKG